MTVGRIVSTAKYTTVTEIESNETGTELHIDIRNAVGCVILEEGVAVVGLHTLLEAINTSLEGTGKHISLWKEV